MARDRGVTEVVVAPADLADVFFDGSVYVVTGTAGNHRVTFIGDGRPTYELLAAVRDSGEAQTALVQNFSIRRRQRIPRSA